MTNEKTDKYSFEVGMFRPPSEGGSYSLLLRFTRNCPWNKCTFCGMYKHEKFSLRTAEEIKSDIDSIASICEEMGTISWKLGYGGEINRDVAVAMLEKEPALNNDHNFVMLYNWLMVGGKTAFLQDGNSLMMAGKAQQQRIASTFARGSEHPHFKRIFVCFFILHDIFLVNLHFFQTF